MGNYDTDGKAICCLFLWRRIVRGDLVPYFCGQSFLVLSLQCVSFKKLDLLRLPEDGRVCLALIRWSVSCLYLLAGTSALHSLLLLRGGITVLWSIFMSMLFAWLQWIFSGLGSGLCPASVGVYWLLLVKLDSCSRCGVAVPLHDFEHSLTDFPPPTICASQLSLNVFFWPCFRRWQHAASVEAFVKGERSHSGASVDPQILLVWLPSSVCQLVLW